MANFKLTQAKRNRERAQKEKRQEKDAKRDDRKGTRDQRQALIDSGVDPDLEGIVPGPHNTPSWE
jgi:hypothetical protein